MSDRTAKLIRSSTRVYFARKRRNQILQRNRLERLAAEQRGEDPGLPTYGESSTSLTTLFVEWKADRLETGRANPLLPGYALSYGAPPAGSPPISTPPAEHNTHFHFHFPSLPAALHLRSSRPDASGTGEAAYPPQYAHEPPKYETDPSAPVVAVEPSANGEGSSTLPPPVPIAGSEPPVEVPSTTANPAVAAQEYEEEFVQFVYGRSSFYKHFH